MQKLAITWLGHSAFLLRTPGGQRLLFDPWFTGNPKFPEGATPKAVDLVLISHGHSDHITDVAPIAKATACRCRPETASKCVVPVLIKASPNSGARSSR